MRNRINKRPEIIGRSLSNLYKKVNNFHPTCSGLWNDLAFFQLTEIHLSLTFVLHHQLFIIGIA
jgi:hypothetical protein